MMMTYKFLAVFVLLLALPVVPLLLGNIHQARMDFRFLIPNYLYMAAPHLLVAIFAFWPQYRRPALLLVLLLLNVLLLTFTLWIKFFVASREAGFAWVLYIPLWVVALVIIGIVLRMNFLTD